MITRYNILLVVCLVLSCTPKLEHWPEVRYSGPYTYQTGSLFVQRIITVESGGNPRARSRAGAVGLMQLMPATANYVSMQLFGRKLSRENLHDPVLNLAIGQAYFIQLLWEFHGNFDKALLAYNAGPANVRKGYRNSYPKKVIYAGGEYDNQ